MIEQPDVDDVGQARAGHAEQEDHVAHDVERREDPAAHLARRVALEEHRSATTDEGELKKPLIVTSRIASGIDVESA